MASGVNSPNVSQVLDIADDFGLELTQEDAESYCTLLQGAVKSYRRIDEMVEYRPRNGLVSFPANILSIFGSFMRSFSWESLTKNDGTDCVYLDG